MKYNIVIVILMSVLTSKAWSNPLSELNIVITENQTTPVLMYLVPNDRLNKGMAARKKTARINSYNNNFSPSFLVISTGDYLEISNQDPFFHNTHIFDRNRTLFNIATPTPDVSVRKIIPRPGLFNVQCDVHPWMYASIAVVDSPYYSVARQPGRYKISDIPQGEYTLHIWQPEKEVSTQQVMLENGEIKTITLGKQP